LFYLCESKHKESGNGKMKVRDVKPEMEMGVGEQSIGVGIGMLYRPYESGKASTDSVWMEMRLRKYMGFTKLKLHREVRLIGRKKMRLLS
jgi:hypothetical protein